jgi:putative ABC transport system ATP-binding protein
VIGTSFIINFPVTFLLAGSMLSYFITVFLSLFASLSAGLLISCLLKNSEGATLPLLFWIVAQIVFSGILFKLDGVIKYISYIVVGRWAMSALGTIFNLNKVLSRLTPPLSTDLYDFNKGNLLKCWVALFLISAICVFGCILVLKKKVRKTSD